MWSRGATIWLNNVSTNFYTESDGYRPSFNGPDHLGFNIAFAILDQEDMPFADLYRIG